MYRSVAALLASMAFFVAAAQAGGTYSDPQGRFSVGVPDNWIAQKPDKPEIALVMLGADQEKKLLLGVCVFVVTEMEESRSSSQEELNATVDKIFTDDVWKQAMKEGGNGDVTVISSGARQDNGRNVRNVVLTMSATKDGVVTNVKAKQEVHMIPGSLHLIACITDPAVYDTAVVDFDAIFKSYAPKSGLVSQAPQSGTSVLTFYAAPKFDGAARVLAQDTPNVPALGFDGQTASVAVSGSGKWEVCEGGNYTGACRALAASESADAGQALRIGSVRRAKPQSGVGAIRAEAAVAIKSALERLRKGN